MERVISKLFRKIPFEVNFVDEVHIGPYHRLGGEIDEINDAVITNWARRIQHDIKRGEYMHVFVEQKNNFVIINYYGVTRSNL